MILLFYNIIIILLLILYFATSHAIYLLFSFFVYYDFPPVFSCNYILLCL
jgi:hypothetical protein